MPSIIDTLQHLLITIFHYLTAFAFATQQESTNTTTAKMQHIVIVGGQYSGVGTAHRFLKKAPKTTPYKVTLISRDSHFYWNLASPRGVVPGQISDKEIFHPIAEGFTQYGDKFEFVLGSATGFDAESQTIKVATANGVERQISYDVLVLATGARTKSDGTPFKSVGSTEATKEALHKYQASIKKAKTIAVIGAGTTGVETTGELAAAYGSDKKIILLASGPAVLNGFPSSNQQAVQGYLKTMKVDLRLNAKVKTSNETAQGQTDITLEGGEKILADFVIPTYGVIPNTSFVPTKFLNQKGYINVDDHLRLQGLKNVYAIGEVSAFEPAQFMALEGQSTYMAKTLQQLLTGTTPAPYKKPSLRMQAVSVSKKHAAGHMFDYAFPSILFRTLRAKFFMDWLPGRVNGEGY
ncbi:putative disulfide oxidoreductase [Sarocladium strictum]